MARGTLPAVDLVAEALTGRERVTVDELSATAGVGRSAVATALRELEQSGAAVREPGGRDGGRRLPDRWTPAVTGDAPLADASLNEVAGLESVSPDDAERDSVGLGDAVPSHASVHPEAHTTDAPRRDRLGKGGLGDLVLAHLVARPAEDHGPVAVAKALGGRSSGAVGNSLQRWCEQGAVVLVSASPRRYRIATDPAAPTKQAATKAGSPGPTHAAGKSSGSRRRSGKGAA